MTKVTTLIIGAMLVATASAFFKGKQKAEPSAEPYEWSVAPKYEVHHTQYVQHYEEPKKEKKWSWLPSWPWKKTKDTHFEKKHFPLWKSHKSKGVQIHPVHVISLPPPQPIIYHSPPAIIHEAQHITHSKVIKEIPQPAVWHHETVKEIPQPEVWHQEIVKEIPQPEVWHQEIVKETHQPEVWHQEIVKEIPHPIYHHKEENHLAPVYNHNEQVHETHEQESADKWKWSEEEALKWSQLESAQHTYEESDKESEKEILSSFLGEGHSIDTLEKLMPTLHKDKKLFNKLKHLHHIKKSWLPTLPKFDHSLDKKSLLKYLPNIFSSHSKEHVPEIIFHEHETHEHKLEETAPHQFPVNPPSLKHFQSIPLGYPIQQTVATTTTVIKHPLKVYELGQPQPNYGHNAHQVQLENTNNHEQHFQLSHVQGHYNQHNEHLNHEQGHYEHQAEQLTPNQEYHAEHLTPNHEQEHYEQHAEHLTQNHEHHAEHLMPNHEQEHYEHHAEHSTPNHEEEQYEQHAEHLTPNHEQGHFEQFQPSHGAGHQEESQLLHNSYGERIPSDSYASPSKKLEIIVPPLDTHGKPDDHEQNASVKQLHSEELKNTKLASNEGTR